MEEALHDMPVFREFAKLDGPLCQDRCRVE